MKCMHFRLLLINYMAPYSLKWSFKKDYKFSVDHFFNYTLLIEGILVLSIRLQHIEIMIWDPMFLRDIWSAQNSKTFELCLSVRPSVRPSVVNTIASERKEPQAWKFAHRLLLPIRWLVLKMGYIGPQNLVPPI